MSMVQLQKLADSIHLSLTDSLCEKLEKFIDFLMAKNKELNLTAVVKRHDVRIKHIIDSLMVARFLEAKPGMRILDLGTGGGLPGIPLAILFPELQFTLVDATAKKVEAVDEFRKALGLTNARTLVGRAEDLAHTELRESFDRVLTRALAPLRVLLELAYPFVHLNGKLFAYKGPEYINELTQTRQALQALQAEPPQVKLYSLPGGMGDRVLIIFSKKFQTPARYPRRDGMPAKRPL